ncbi:MAG TPA: hypothetical protein IAC82_13590 [Candidatus Merdivicinus intestinigallinarum]|nr:hypothetical protein [Candidatus Merdivicinus intestinigallinarum]
MHTKGETSVFTIIGAIYLILGCIFLVLGGVLSLAVSEDGVMIGTIFGGIGGIFALLGAIFLFVEHRKEKQIQRLLEGGRYIEGEIVDFQTNYNVSLNNRHPIIVIVRYQDLNGVAHIFKSRSLRWYPDPAVIGQTVKVYVEDDSFQKYYVDMSEVLSQTIEH